MKPIPNKKMIVTSVLLLVTMLLLGACGATNTPVPVPTATATKASTVAPTTAPPSATVVSTTALPTIAPTRAATTAAPTVGQTQAVAPTTAPAIVAQATPAPKPAVANEAQGVSLIKLVDSIDELKVKIDFATEGSTNLTEFKGFMNEALLLAATARTNTSAAKTAFANDSVATARLTEIEAHFNNLITAGQNTLKETDLNKAIQASLPVIIYGKSLAYLQTLELMVDTGVSGTISGVVTDNAGKPLPDSYVSVKAGPIFQATKTDGSGKFNFTKAPAYNQIEVKSYQTGLIYHEEKVPLTRGGQVTVTLRMPPMPRPTNAPVATNPTIKADPANPRLLNFSLNATDPQNDVSEQIYALNVQLGIAVPLEFTGNNNLWAGKYTLPANAPKDSEWVLFAVDRMCNQGLFLPVKYTAS